jgi:hypothetical protein
MWLGRLWGELGQIAAPKSLYHQQMILIYSRQRMIKNLMKPMLFLLQK